jgi:hypothetical protein
MQRRPFTMRTPPMIRQFFLAAALLASGVTAGAATAPAAAPNATAAAPVLACLHEPITGRDFTVQVPPATLPQIVATGGYAGACATYGDTTSLGDGKVRSYAQFALDGSPTALGIELSAATFNNLPQEDNDGNNCWDVNNNGIYDDGECAGGHQRILFFPPLKNTPFKWFLLNWDPHGHPPQGIYSVPHFDLHFYTLNYLARNLIRPGPCAIVVNCADFNKATIPVPSQYLHYDYKSVGAVAAREGDHLLDFTSPEFGPGGQNDFTHTFIFGAYEGRLAFWEPMITLSFLQGKPSACTPIKLPMAYQAAGYYPTRYCIRYRGVRNDYTISLEEFKFRPAS